MKNLQKTLLHQTSLFSRHYMYSLFIDTLSSPAFICLFDIDKSIKDSISWVARHAEFDTLTESIDTVINRNNLEYNQIKEIICIV